jgi:hypothetical protein
MNSTHFIYIVEVSRKFVDIGNHLLVLSTDVMHCSLVVLINLISSMSIAKVIDCNLDFEWYSIVLRNSSFLRKSLILVLTVYIFFDVFQGGFELGPSNFKNPSILVLAYLFKFKNLWSWFKN